MDEILDDLDVAALPSAAARDGGAEGATTPPVGLHVTGCAARDDLDEAALRILTSRLSLDGVRVTMLPSTLLVAEVVERVAVLSPEAAVVASVGPGGLAQSRHLIKRLRSGFAELPIVAVRWGPPDGITEARTQLIAAGANEFAATLREARERIMQYRQVRAEPTPSQAA